MKARAPAKGPTLNLFRGRGPKGTKFARSAPPDTPLESQANETDREERGVVEVTIRDKARRAFEMWDSTGECLVYVEWPRERATQQRIDELWEELDREDPIAKPLKLEPI